jgi:hypothetical protein
LRVPEDWKIAGHALSVLTHRSVEHVTLTPEWGLVIRLSGDAVFSIEPTPDDDETEWPYWSLYLNADDRILEVGPNREWSLLPYAQRRYS